MLFTFISLLTVIHASGFILPDNDIKRTNYKKIYLSATPSWDELEFQLPSTKYLPPANIDSALNPLKPSFSSVNPTLFRERHGWCPYSERVWLTLEHLNVEYDTVRIDNTGHGPRPNYYAGQTPQLRWADGKMQSESMDLVSALIESYPSSSLSCENNNQTQDSIRAFKDIFPRGSRPSSRAAFLFSYSGGPLPRSEFERVLSETDSFLLSSTGPFFCGESMTAADIAWVPFLERYAAQLPCLYENLEPNDADTYPNLAKWYASMDTIPAYACRIKGDASSWRKVLVMAGYGNAGQIPNTVTGVSREVMESKVGTSTLEKEIWKEYISTRPYLAETSSMEAAAIIYKNKEAILKDIERRMSITPSWKSKLPNDLDSTLRGLTMELINDGDDDISNESRDIGTLASFLDERMCVPRDMGAMSAAAVKRIALKYKS